MRHSTDRFPLSLFALAALSLALAVVAGEALTWIGGL